MHNYFRNMSDKQLLLCSICCNFQQLQHSIDHFTRTCKIYQRTSMHICVVDNEAITEFMNNYKAIDGLCITKIDRESVLKKCVVRDLHNVPCDLEVNTYLYNDLFDKIEKYIEIDYVVLFDASNGKCLPIQKILQVINQVILFDIIISNDIDNEDFLAAYRSEKCPAGIDIMGQCWQHEISREIKMEVSSSSEDLIRILSGYSSLTIFNRRSINKSRCSIIPCEELDFHYRNICNDLIMSTTTSINGCMTGMYLYNMSPMFYRLTNNLNFPVVHPFVNLCFDMRKMNNIQMFVNKTLKWT